MAKRHPEWPLERKVYVGGLPDRVAREDLEDCFGRYGRIENVWVARQPPGFAFVLFEDERDARDAARALDGSRICGVRARVELSHGLRRNRDGMRNGGGSGGSSGGRRSPKYNEYDARSRRRRSRSKSRSRSRSRSYSRSRSRSPKRSSKKRTASGDSGKSNSPDPIKGRSASRSSGSRSPGR